MDTHSDPLFHFTTAFVAAASSTAAAQNSRRKRTRLIKSTDNDLLSPSSSGAGIAKPKYGKKPDPTAPKITRPCSECGKKFWSWKALFGHMRCHPERQWRGINPPPNFRRSSCPTQSETTEEDHEIAACLIILANGPNAIDRTEAVTETDDCGQIQESETTTTTAAALGRFIEPSSCKKVFGSHPGRRARQKNVKNRRTAAEDQWSGEAQSHQNHQPYSVMKEEGCGYLDLNLPPPMEDIEESSSSYSSQLVLDLRLGLS